MGKLVRKRKKPILVHSLYASEKPHSLELLKYYDIPVYDSLDIAVKCMGVLAEYGRYQSRSQLKTNFVINWGAKAKPEVQKIIAAAGKEGRRALLEHEAKQLLKLHGAVVSNDRLAATPEEAVAFAKQLNQPVVLKIVSPHILHKSDAGGVQLDLRTEKDIKQAYKRIITNARKYNKDADIRGVLVCPQADEGVEVIIGTKIDDQFGPVIMYGLGGVMVEILKDVAFRVLPLTPTAAKNMIQETKSFPILNGARGRKPLDTKALRRLLLLCSDILDAYPEIEEMDLNPVIVYESGLSLVDARIILKSAGQ